MHVHRRVDGSWRADWPDHEGYDLGPPSIAWITWHIDFWWSMTLDHCFDAGTLTREAVTWRGSAEGARDRIRELHDEWVARIEGLTEDDLRSPERSRWPIPDRPFADIVSWLNVELMKNAAEIGYARFLHGVAPR